MANIKQRISLDGADDVAAKLKKIGDTGADAFKKLKEYSGQSLGNVGEFAKAADRHVGEFAKAADRHGDVGGEDFGKKLREALHALHPVAEQAGIDLGNLGQFGRLAGAGLIPLGAAITGSLLFALAKVGEEAAKTKQHLDDLVRSPEAGNKLFEGLKRNAADTGTTSKDAGGYVEAMLRLRDKLEAENGGIVGSPSANFGPLSTNSVLAAEKVLTQRGILGGLTADKAKAFATEFGESILKDGTLTPDLIEKTSRTSQGLANWLATTLSGNTYETPEGLKIDAQRWHLNPGDINDVLARQAPSTQAAFDKRPKYVSDQIEASRSLAGRTVEKVGDTINSLDEIERTPLNAPIVPLQGPNAQPPDRPFNAPQSPEPGPGFFQSFWNSLSQALGAPPPQNTPGPQSSADDQAKTSDVAGLGSAARDASDGLKNLASIIAKVRDIASGTEPSVAAAAAGGGNMGRYQASPCEVLF